MNTPPGLPSPSLRSLIRGADLILDKFNPKKIIFLDEHGLWRENPSRLNQRVSNEILFFLWSLNKKQRIFFIAFVIFPLAQKFWKTVKWIKISYISEHKCTKTNLDEQIFKIYKDSPLPTKARLFSIILDAFVWFLGYETIRVSASSFVSDWDNEGQKQRQEWKNKILFWDNLIQTLPPGIDVNGFISTSLEKTKQYFPGAIDSLLKTIADEERITDSIKRLSNKIKTVYDQDEISSLIIEKIQPPTGIVTHTSPGLLHPCLDLLKDDRFDICSGIAYQSSVILSILQDPRSTEGLLQAMEGVSLQFTKIRENLIYTLGKLKASDAISTFAQILDSPDEIVSSEPGKPLQSHLLIEQKAEVIRSLGEIGLDAVTCLDLLIKYTDHKSDKLKTYLAWCLGDIGYEQKKSLGGVSADILITLLKLMKIKSRQVFEEAVHALKKIEMPEFVHALHLYDVGAVNILGLKPANRGLYELSETIHYLIKTQGRAVIAVNGDSGTGKTYFCQSLMDGFGDIRPAEIIYLMRDRKKDQKIFNRILGLKWLKDYIEPSFYQDYPVSEEEDDPFAYFQKYIDENRDKKLIILDGCRDGTYFQRVIDLFYIYDILDIEVNFRATFSTRRLNLEEREVALESIKTHLSFLEEPILEDTKFYQEGKILIYDLDNSLSSRLNRRDIKELFQKTRIPAWGELVMLGEFPQEKGVLKFDRKDLQVQAEKFTLKKLNWPGEQGYHFQAKERKFHLDLNNDTGTHPHLLFSLEADDLEPSYLRFYAQDQIAGAGRTGKVFILTFIDNRIFHIDIDEISEIRLWGRDLYTLGRDGNLAHVSFEQNTLTLFNPMGSPACSLIPIAHKRLITGHQDGTLTFWNLSEHAVSVILAHEQAVSSLTCDYYGNYFSGSSEGNLKKWDLVNSTTHTWSGIPGKITKLYGYNQDTRIVISREEADPDNSFSRDQIKIILLKDQEEQMTVFSPHFMDDLSGLNVQKDGRIICSFSSHNKIENSNSLVIFQPRENECTYSLLPGQQTKTTDCIVMGPKILSCGQDAGGEYTLKCWGTEYLVKMELKKLKMVQP
ncbi:MAG: hypothetical protein JW755_12475 [Candidatus Aminicenantes bacterium]|nr:hypothetical protein [Candidatus Aminicenantes bacterium]